MQHAPLEEIARQVDALAASCERLRRSQRRWRLAFIVSSIGLFVLAGATHRQQGPPKEIRAERFVLVDPGGVVRGTWETNEADTTGLQVFDRKGRRRISLLSFNIGRSDGTPSIGLHDDTGLVRLSTSLTTTENPMIIFSDKDENIITEIPKDMTRNNK